MATIAFEDLTRRSRSRHGLGVLEIVGSAYRGEDCVLRMEFTGMFATRG